MTFMNSFQNIGESDHILHSEKDGFYKQISNLISRANHEIVLISPYIKIKILKDLLSDLLDKRITIITSWRLKDMLEGASDIELYTFCKENKITLFINQRVHLKAIIIDYKSCIHGSANVTAKGLALSENYNYELASFEKNLSINDILYFKKILFDSTLVNQYIYESFKNALIDLPFPPKLVEPDLSLIKPKSEFLISALPMSSSPAELYVGYIDNFKTLPEDKKLCGIHDILLYNIPEHLNESEFNQYLTNAFFGSEFISSLLEYVSDEKYFGEVKAWIQNKCEDVPVPSRRDLTGNIQVLYRWIVDLSNGVYGIDIPYTHSQRIYKT